MSASFPSAVKTFPTRNAGQSIASAHMNDVQDEVNAIESALLVGPIPAALTALIGSAIAPAWTTYTPTWTGVSVNPTLGDGTLTGRYLQIGKLVWVHIDLLMGSTTSFGTGSYRWALPVTAMSAQGSALSAIGSGLLLDSGTNFRTVVVYLNNTTTLRASHDSDGGSGIAPTSPFTFAAGDRISLHACYEAA